WRFAFPKIGGWRFGTCGGFLGRKGGRRPRRDLPTEGCARGGNRVAHRLLHRLHARRRRRRLFDRALRRVRVGHLCEPRRVPGAVFWVPLGGLVARGVGEQATLGRVSRVIARSREVRAGRRRAAGISMRGGSRSRLWPTGAALLIALAPQ